MRGEREREWVYGKREKILEVKIKKCLVARLELEHWFIKVIIETILSVFSQARKKYNTENSPLAVFIFLYKLKTKTILCFSMFSAYQTSFLLLEMENGH